MKVVLLEDIARLGNKYDVKEVADGFARNFLLPCKKAAIASKDILASIEKKRQEHEKERTEREQALENILGKLGDAARVTIKAKINEKGGLFATIGAPEIAGAIKEQLRIDIPESFVSVGNPIKQRGEHTVSVGEGSRAKNITVHVEPMR